METQPFREGAEVAELVQGEGQVSRAPQEEPGEGDQGAQVELLPAYGPKIWTGFAFALAALLLVGVTGYVGATDSMSGNHWVDHTRRVIENLLTIRSTLRAMQADQRAYLISRNRLFLKRADAAYPRLNHGIKTVQALTTDNPLEHRRSLKLGDAIYARFNLLKPLYDGSTGREFDNATALLKSTLKSGQNLLETPDIKRRISQMIDTEQSLLKARNRTADSAGSFTLRVIAIGSIAAFGFVAFAGVFIGRVLGDFKRRANELAQSHENLRAANRELEKGRTAAVEYARELARSQRALSEQSELLSSVLNGMGEGVIARDLQGKTLLFNPMAEQILGAEGLKGDYSTYLNKIEVYSADNRRINATEFPLTRAMKGEDTIDEEQLVRPRDGGEPRWIESSARPIKDQSGEIIGATLVFRDITQRKSYEREIAWLAAIVSSSTDAIVGKTPDGVITSWNPGAETLYGYSASEVIGRNAEFLYPEAERREFQTLLKRLSANEFVQHSEGRRVRKDGSVIDVEVTYSPIRDRVGGIIGISAIARDITEAKRVAAELERRSRELERSNSELEQFAYSASHDLQEPLRMVASYVQLLRERYRDRLDSDADDFIDYAYEGATRMKQLINDLLTYSRAGRGSELKQVETGKPLEWALANLKLAIEESGATVTHDPMPVVMGDRLQLQQVFQNLIGNALKFRADRPLKIHIGARFVNGQWQFSVADNGIGIEPQYFERIFLMFQRLHNRTEYSGTGIGLAICRRIVERHGGKIWIESTPGVGTTFYFTIPPLEENAAVAAQELAQNGVGAI